MVWWKLAVVGLVVAWASACTSSEVVHCDNGSVCPGGYTCVTGGGCLSPQQLTACAGLAEDDSCSVSGLGAGRCHDGACFVSICGNSRIELDEVCDDGNVISGDGCSGTCSSDETCGNGVFELQEECDCGDAERPGGVTCNGTINGGAVCSETCRRRFCGNAVVELDEVCDDGNAISGDDCSFDCRSTEICPNGILDSAAGEDCDDGNTRNRDGCSATCKAEQLSWREVVLDDLPDPRSQLAMAYDVARQRTVMLHGTAVGDNSTWEFDGVSWRVVATTGPPNASGYGMVYDANRARVVLFGKGRVTPGAETWEFDGVSWTKLAPATSPPPRGVHAMAYDSRRKRIVIFGGFGGGAMADTWEFDGTTWIPRSPTMSPSARYSACAAYDPKRDKVVMFGGGNFTATDETWEYDGMTWTPRTALSPRPPPMYGCGMVWDSVRNTMVMFGGSSGAPQTWEYDGQTWTPASTTGTPAFRGGYGFAFDQARKQTVMFGGTVNASVIVNETYLYNGTAWSPPLNTPPSPRLLASMAYDVGAGKVVLYGGFSDGDATVPVGDTWHLDDTRWVLVPGAGPPARGAAAIAYDRVRRRMVLYGGRNATTTLAETWELNSTTWGQRTISGVGALMSSSAVFDPGLSSVVLFGGADDPEGTLFNGTWQLGTSGWSALTTTSTPSERAGAGMCFDESLGRSVLLGGQVNGAGDTTTYQLDSATGVWSTAAAGPPLPSGHAMAYDSLRRHIVLYGGQFARDTWERSGTTWEYVTPPASPPEMRDLAMAYDIANGQVVVFGGINTAFVVQGGTWRYGYVALAAGEACQAGIDYDRDGKVGCADDECWTVCTPLCPPGTSSCGTLLRCGDGVCSGNESCRSCPSDCAVGIACTAACGDFFCDAGETNVGCPGDCP